jgi:hypothetical protein
VGTDVWSKAYCSAMSPHKTSASAAERRTLDGLLKNLLLQLERAEPTS